MKRERTVESALITYAKRRGIRALKLEGPEGWPDRTLLGDDGLIAFVECKRPSGGRRSRLQVETIAKLQAMGHRAEFINSQDDARAFVDSLLEIGK